MNNNINNAKRKKGCLISILLIILLPIVLAVVGFKLAPEYAKAPKDVSFIMQKTNTNRSQADKINEIFKQCEITNVKDIIHDDALDGAYGGNEKGYRLQNDSVKNIILYLRNDNSVYYIKYADNVIYNDNQSVLKISDFTFTLNEETQLQLNSQRAIKDILKSPSTVDFPNIDEWEFYKDKEKIMVKSYVDAENSFGAKIKSEFQITLLPDGKTVKSILLDGKEYL